MSRIIEAINRMAEAVESWNPEPTRVMVAVALVMAAFLLLEAIAWAI